MSKCPFLANKHEIFAGSPDIMSCHKIYHTIIHYWENRCGKINCQQRLVTVHSASTNHVTRLHQMVCKVLSIICLDHVGDSVARGRGWGEVRYIMTGVV